MFDALSARLVKQAGFSDGLFIEALQSLEQIKKIAEEVPQPKLINYVLWRQNLLTSS
ncbi:hypothetical protein [Candidatus Coxiella mudrowiae]|uniref:hypothetical protein n=1 Tax=Candidatus Coxiella mudrowiae TaxID=2054173 RepID=UPI0012FE9683|nr:hypothetical protein [Candidatus Coxiella mudrowiae]